MKKLIYILPLLFFAKITLAQDKQQGTLQTIKVQGGGGGNGTVKSVSKTDGYGYSSTITNPTTTPNITGSVDTVVIPSKPFLSNELAKKQDTSYHTNFYAESPLSVRDTITIEGVDTVHGVISSLDNLNMPELSYEAASRDTTNWRTNNTLVDEQFLTDRINAIPSISGGIDSVKRKVSTDTIYQYKSGAPTLSFLTLKWFNAKNYGLSTVASSSVNTTAIKNAAAAALAAGGGTVYIPAGTYLVDSISYNAQVSFIGDGLGSILKSNSAVSMFTNTSDLTGSGTFTNLVLDGNSIGTIAFNWYHVFDFKVENLYIQNFTNCAANLSGSLMGKFENVHFLNNPTGVKAVAASGMQPNFVAFNKCLFNGSTKWAINWVNGAGISFTGCDFEQNGTTLDNTTGVLQFASMAASSEGNTVTLANCWFEQNKSTYLNILAPAGAANYFIDRTVMIPDGSGSYGIQMANGGGSGSTNNLTIINSTIKNFTTKDLAATGAYAIVTNLYSTIGTTSFTSGATYNNNTNGNFTASTLAAVGSTGNFTMQKATVNYRNWLVNDATLYSPNDNMAFLVDNSSKKITFAVGNNTPSFRIYTNYVNADNITLGAASRTAILSLPAGTATAQTAPLKFAAGTNLTTPENGAVEFDGTNYYVTTSGTRYVLTRTLSGTAAPTTTPAAIGIQFVDTTNKKIYVSTGTSSSADWTILN